MTQETVEVEFAGHTVQVPAGGYYDRFRSNPDLDAAARDPAAGNIDFFRRIPKVQLQARLGHAHVLALPVDTEIARLRGVMVYQLPKWLAKIDLNLDGLVRA